MDAQLALMHIENRVELIKQIGAGISAVIKMFPDVQKLEDIDELGDRAFTYIMHNGKGHLNPSEVRIHLLEFLNRLIHTPKTTFKMVKGVEHEESISTLPIAPNVC